MTERRFLVAIELCARGQWTKGNIMLVTNTPITFQTVETLKADYCQHLTDTGTPCEPKDVVITAMIQMEPEESTP